MIAYAADFTYVNTLIGALGDVINYLLPLVVTLGLIYFFWNCILLIRAEGDEDRAEYRSSILWSLIALFVMVSVWGLVFFINTALGLSTGGMVPLPEVDDEGNEDADPVILDPI